MDEVSDIESLDGLDTEASVGALEGEIEILASLSDPAKLDSLTGKRAATPRLRKACYWLHTATDPAEAIEQAQIQNGSQGTSRAQETAKSLLRNLTILERLGCLDDAGLDKLRRGNAPTITKDS